MPTIGEGKDYITVSLKHGAIHVAMDLGSGSYSDHVDLDGYKLDDGQWHSIEVSRDSRLVCTCHITLEVMKLAEFSF